MSKNDEWGTPQRTFNIFDEHFDFDVDLCASEDNAFCDRYYSKEHCALENFKPNDYKRFNWNPPSVFCNPPYSMAKEFAEFALTFSSKIPAVFLMPVRTDRIWFQRWMETPSWEQIWITGRIYFDQPGAPALKPASKAAFMYSVIFYQNPGLKYGEWPQWIDASELNDSLKGGAKS